MIDVEFRVVGWWFFKLHPTAVQIIVPRIHLLTDQGEDDALSLFAAAEMLAKAEESAAARAVNTTGALVEDERQAENVFIKIGRLSQISRV